MAPPSLRSRATEAIDAALPIIDISGLRRDDSARFEVARQLRSACEERGFFYIRGHGVSPDLIGRLFRATEAFFEQSAEAKLKVRRTSSPYNRGYDPLQAQTLEPGAPPDLKESFLIGNELAANDPRVLGGRFNAGPNQWPEGLAGFRATMDEYFDVALELAELLVHGIGLSLALPEGSFDDFVQDASAVIRLLHYPQQPAAPRPREKGCGEHTDSGALTLLLQDDSGGLQVWDARSRSWTDAPPLPGTYVVNIGDLFARWTNGRYHSTLHRVINRSGRRRYSIPFFFSGNFEYTIECLPSCIEPGGTPRFPPITVQKHQQDFYRRTYG